MYNQLSTENAKYLKSNAKLISKDEEVILMYLAQHGNVKAKTKLVNSQLAYIAKFARRYARQNCHIDDLFMEGCSIAFGRAIDTYDITKGANYHTFLTYQLMDVMQTFSLQTSQLVPIPMNIHRKHLKLLKELRKNKDYEGLATVNDPHSVMFGIDDKIDEEGHCIADVFADEASDLNNIINDSDRSKAVANAISGLDEESRTLINNLYGFSCEKMTVVDLSNRLKVTRTTINNRHGDILELLQESTVIANV